MVLGSKNVIIKAIFAVTIVAATAVVGIAGFAQAAPRPLINNGYGGGIGQILVAIREFQASLRSASQTFHKDVRACFNAAHTDMDHRGVTRNAAAESQFQSATSGYTQQTENAVSLFSAKLASPSALGSSTQAFNNHFKTADDDAQNRFSTADNNLSVALDRLDAARNRSSLNACLRTARTKYHAAIDVARQRLLDALRSIFG